VPPGRVEVARAGDVGHYGGEGSPGLVRGGLIDTVVERIDVLPGIGKPFVNVDGVTMRFDKDRVVITWRRDDSGVAPAA
jgi:hypothetical protein